MQVELLDSANALSTSDWQTLATGGDPFASRAFLGSFDQVGAGGTAIGAQRDHPALIWHPQHLLLRDEQARPAALLPMYLRQHSFGDFSRDWGWADAWHQAGRSYYPKLVSGIPYTPSPGPRLLVRRDMSHRDWAEKLSSAAIAATQELGASSWQCLFVEDADRDVLAAQGCLLRRGVQFHWRNAGYRDFADFLDGFTSEKRKKLKRERRGVSESGLRLEARHGNEIDASLWQRIHQQYQETFARYGNHPALPLAFFTAVGALLGRQLVVFLAWQGDDAGESALVASAICYRDETTLYGRHWGCARQVPGLHFELCYYQGIDYCLAHGLERFEPGAQGEHKLARGFVPTDTWSAFWIADPGLRRAVANYLEREDAAMQDYAAESASHLPFKGA